jgi:U6 snRNA-associated Sm-like protein LSm1
MSASGAGGEDQYLPGAASLLAEIDKRILIILRDGRHLVGTLRSFDHFMNLILEDTCERVVMNNKYADVELGLNIVRGDTIVLLGQVDEDKDKESGLVKVDPSEIDEDEIGESTIEWDFDDMA